MIIDIALLVISVLVVVLAIKKGFIGSIFGLVAWVVAVIIVLKFSMPVSEWIFDNIVREKVIHSLSEKLTEDYAYGTAQSNFSVFAQTMSQVLDSTSKLLNISLTNSIQNLNPASMNADKIAEVITDNYLATIIMYFIKWIVSVIGFVILVILFSYIGKILVKLIRNTPFKHADKLLGGIVGVIKAFVIVLVLCSLMQISTGIIYSNGAISTMLKDKDETKKSAFVEMVDNSKIVSFVNEKSPINQSLYKW